MASPGTSGEARSRLDERGFVMVALLVAMAITAIWLGTMLPAWRQQAVRQREDDLIFRGQQYARAIALYFLNNNCTLPGDVDILLSRHYLRKKWKDPIANDDFVPMMAGTTTSFGGSPGTPQAPNRPAAPASSGGQTLMGVFGVSSKSTDTSIKVYQNQQQYSLWSFRYTDALQLMGRSGNCNNNQNGGQPGRGNPATPGQPGQAGQPGRGPGNGPAGPVGPGGGAPRPGGGNGPPPPGIGTNGPGRGRGMS